MCISAPSIPPKHAPATRTSASAATVRGDGSSASPPWPSCPLPPRPHVYNLHAASHAAAGAEGGGSLDGLSLDERLGSLAGGGYSDQPA